MISCAGRIMISHLKGSSFAIAARRTDSFTFFRTTNVPTAPMLTMPNLESCLAIRAGWQRLVPPTFTARRKTTEDIVREDGPLLADDFHQSAFSAAAVEFAIEDLFPRAEIEFAFGDGDDDFAA